MSQNQSEPYAYISKGNSIQYVKIEETNNIDIFDNEENTFSADENVDIPYCTKTRLQTCDIITTQVKTNYSGVSARIRNSKGLDQELSVVKRTIDMSLLSYDVYEFKINFSNYEEGTYDVVVKFSDGNFGDQYFQSENIDLKELHEGTVHIRYYDESNGDIFYTYGLKNVGNILRVPLVDLSLKDNQESQISEGDNSTVMVMSEVYEQVQFFFDCVTGKYLRTLVIALSSENLFLNNVGYVKQEELEAEILGRTNIYESNVLLNKSGVDFIPPIPGRIMDIDLYRYTSINRIFTVYPDDKIYFFGTGSNVSIGDKLAFDESGENVLTGNDNYFGISNTEWVQVDENGIVIDKGLILEEVPFIMEVEIPSDNFDFQFSRPSRDGALENGVSAIVDWGDGTSTQWDDSNYNSNTDTTIKTYSSSGTYQIKISGRVSDIRLQPSQSASSVSKILQWGDLGFYGFYFKNLINCTEIPKGAVTGFLKSNRGTKYNEEVRNNDLMLMGLDYLISLEELPIGYTEFIKYEDTGWRVGAVGSMVTKLHSLKEIPEDFLSGLYYTNVAGLFRDSFSLESVPKDLFNNAYKVGDSVGNNGYGYYALTNAGKNNLGDPSKTIVLNENFLSNCELTYGIGNYFTGWNIDSVPENIFKNSLSSIENGGTGKINLNSTFYGCTKLTSLPDNLLKDFQIQSSCREMIINTSITHVKSSWWGGTIQQNNIDFYSFARGGIVDTIDEDLFDVFNGEIYLKQGFYGNSLLIQIPLNIFKNCIISNVQQCFEQTGLKYIGDDLIYQSTETLFMNKMFYKCYDLEYVGNIFHESSNTVEVTVSSFIELTNVRNMGETIFQNVNIDSFSYFAFNAKIENIYLTQFSDNNSATSLTASFRRCSISVVPEGFLSKFNAVGVDYNQMFGDQTANILIHGEEMRGCTETINIYGLFGYANIDNITIDFFRDCSKVENAASCFVGRFGDKMNSKVLKREFWSYIPLNRKLRYSLRYNFQDIQDSDWDADVFYDMTELTDAFRMFWGARNLGNSYPSTLFANNTKLTNVKETFIECDLTEIKQGLFENNPLINDFQRTFHQYSVSVGKSIPQDLFASNTASNVNLDTVFSELRDIETIPSRIFAGLDAIEIEYCFNKIYDLITVPSDVFEGISDYSKITNLRGIFNGCESLVSIPENTLSNFTSAQTLERAFYQCVSLQEINIDFSVFNDLTNISSMFYDCKEVENAVPRLWENPQYTTYNDCFKNCTKALNYPEIPISWGGTNDGSITRLGFYIDENGYADSNSVQNGGETSWLVHNGANEEPSVGDTIYQDYEPSTDVFIGLDKYYAIKENKWIQISSSGEVLSKGDSSAPSLGLEILTFSLASRIPQGVNLVIDRTIGQGVVTQQISYRQTGTTNFLLGVSTTDRLTIMTQTGLISSQTYDFQLTLIDDNETVVSDIITVSIQ